MKHALKLAFTLALYSVVACSALAIVNSFTAPIIAEAKEKKLKTALKEVFPDGTEFEDILEKLKEPTDRVKIKNAYLVKNGDQVLGLTITAEGNTYKNAVILVGFNVEKKIKAVKFIELNDTKGIGTRVLDEPFISQFNEKDIESDFLVGKDVEGIAGASISSKGVTKIIRVASTLANSYMKEMEGN